MSARSIPGRASLISRVTIAWPELEDKGVSRDDLEPFFFDAEIRNQVLYQQQIGNSDIDRHPLLARKESLVVVLPTALSTAVRNFAIQLIAENNLAKAFNVVLADRYASLFHKTTLLGGPARAPVDWNDDEHCFTSSFRFRVDEGYFISYHLFLPSIEAHDPGGFKSPHHAPEGSTDSLQEQINHMVEETSNEPGFKQGIILVVGCGWGKGVSMKEMEVADENWQLQFISAPDLLRLSDLENMSPSYLWRVLSGLKTIEDNGVHIINPNGILNLIAWIRRNDGHLIPHAEMPDGEISPDRPLIFNPPPNLLREVRADADQEYDRHCVLDNMERWHYVQRALENSYFKSTGSKRICASLDDLDDRVLTCIYEGKFLLWVTVETPNITDSSVTYQLWKMAAEWLHRIGAVLDEEMQTQDRQRTLRVYARFQDANPSDRFVEKPSYQTLAECCEVKESSETATSIAVFKTGFLNGFSIAENTAERLFVWNVVRAFLSIAKGDSEEELVQKFVANIVPNQQARSFHFFHAQHFLDYVRSSLPEELVHIDEIDSATSRVGLGWRILDRSQGNTLTGRKKCTTLLNQIVDSLIEEIQEMLGRFERASTLERLVRNIEKANAEEDHWKRTSAAILGLHGENIETPSTYVKQLSKFAGAAISSRVIAEIALCTCPANQNELLSNIEMSQLLARAALLIRIGGLSDAIYYNVLKPELAISPLGDILFRDEFGELVVNPMLKRSATQKFVRDAPSQMKNYEEPGFTRSSKDKINPEFWDTWKNEMGFDIDEGRNIIGALEDEGESKGMAVFRTKKSEYFRQVCSDDVSRSAAASFLSQFTLSTRTDWRKPPKGFALKDIYPWRFRRRLSFVTRPILQLDESDDPLLLVAPGALRKGFAYVIDGAYSGVFDQSFFKSKEMRDDWWGKASEGHSFNKQVTKKVADAGWEVRENIGLPEILNQRIDQDFGDIDVLAWKPGCPEVLAIECKDLAFAKNYSEIAAQLSNYQGLDSKSKPDKLKRHLTRISILDKNLDKLAAFTGINSPNLTSCLVCSDLVPMQYAEIETLSNTHVGTIEEILAQ